MPPDNRSIYVADECQSVNAYLGSTELDVRSLSPFQYYRSIPIGKVTKVWDVQGSPAIAINGASEPTYWWQNNKWKKVSFLSLTVTLNDNDNK